MQNGSVKDPVKVGVIGTGALGRHHARLYKECENAELIGIWDQAPEVASRVADEFGTRAYSSFEGLLEQADGVSVATPTDTHYELVRLLLENQLHVLVEKPICQTVQEAEKLVSLATEKNLVLHVGHVERYNPVLKCLDEVPGPPRFIEAHRMASYPPPRPGLYPRGTEVSVVLDLMIHELDVVLQLVKSEVRDVHAVGVPILSATEDIANVRLTFANGTVANLTASRVSERPMRRIRVFKNSAYLALDYQEQKGEIAYLKEGSIVREPVPVRQTNALQEELQDFIDCIHTFKSQGQLVREPKVTGEHGLAALRLADRIHAEISRSAANMGAVES